MHPWVLDWLIVVLRTYPKSLIIIVAVGPFWYCAKVSAWLQKGERQSVTPDWPSLT